MPPPLSSVDILGSLESLALVAGILRVPFSSTQVKEEAAGSGGAADVPGSMLI